MIKELPLHQDLIKWRQETLLERDSKYSALTQVLKRLPLGLQLGYYFGRWVDDVVDGDEPLPSGFNDVDGFLDHLEGTSPESTDESLTSIMLSGAITELQPLENPALGDDVQGEFSSFLKAMRWEYHRSQLRLTLSETEIEQGYWEGFSHAQNITLIALKSQIRVPSAYPPVHRLLEMGPEEMPLALPMVLGKAYSVKDLEVDLAKGIFNIPRSILNQSGLTPASLFEQPGLARSSPVINAWADEELAVSHQLAVNLRHKRLDLPAKAMVGFLTYNL